jgi:glycosyltransferase involved in cell wall biosynthesis
MKVLMLDPLDANPYGPDLASALWMKGIDVRLLVAIGFQNRARTRCPFEEISARGGRGRFTQKLLDEVRYLHRIWRLAREWRPDVIHVQWLRMSAELALISRLRSDGLSIVITAHNVLPHEDASKGIALQRRFYNTATRIIVHEPAARDDLQRLMGISETIIDVVPHGIPEEQVKLGDRRSARRRLGIDEEPATFLCFGGIRPYKGHSHLLEVFADAVSQGCTGQLMIAGWGTRSAVGELRAKVERLDARTRQRVYMMVREDSPIPGPAVEDLFNASDCVVLPYRSISQSGVLFQAFRFEKPVLASSVGGLAQVVESGFNGQLIDPNDRSGWAAAIASLASSPELLRQWGRQARARAVEQFGHGRVALQTIATYQRAINEPYRA